MEIAPAVSALPSSNVTLCNDACIDIKAIEPPNAVKAPIDVPHIANDDDVIVRLPDDI
jgi:hypothetical protein